MSLVEYIQQLRQYGYTPSQIEQYLSQQGYDVQTIRQSMKEAGVTTPKGTLLIAVVVVLLVIVGIASYIFLFPEPVPVDVSASIINAPEPGKDIQVTVDVSGEKKQDVRLVLEIIREDSGVLMNAKREGLGVVKDESKTIKILLPSRAQPGAYKVKVTATAGKLTSTAAARFTIEEKKEVPIPKPKEPQANETQQNETPQLNETPSVQVNETPVIQPTGKLTIDEIKELAKTDIAKAEEDCKTHDLPDSCFNAIAHVANKPSYCEPVKASLTRDSCYSGFALEGDYSVCSKITSEALRKSCESLKAFNEQP